MPADDPIPPGRLERYAPLAGIATAVLWVAGLVVLEAGGANPAAPESADVLVEHFRDNRSAILAAGTLHALGGFFFLWFVASLHTISRALDRPGGVLGSAAFAGGIAAGALMLALLGPQATGATTDAELLGPDSSLAFWRLAHVFFVAAEFAMAVFVAAVSLLALRSGLLPRWLGWAGLVLAVVLLIVPIAWLALLFLVPLWLVAVSVVLFRRPLDEPRAG